MRAGCFLLLLIFYAAGISAREDKVVSFSEEIFYNGDRKEIHQEIDRLLDRNINFKAQTSFTLNIPDTLGSSSISNIEKILTDVENFTDIPYYSKRHDSTYPLFRDITVLEDVTDKNGIRIITADQTILPFKPAQIRYTIENKENFILFKAENIENIRWWIFPVITKQKLLILFAAEIKNGRLECYGLGTADTGSFFFMRKRLKDAFNGRTEALIRWLHKMLNEKFSFNEVEDWKPGIDSYGSEIENTE